VLLAEGGVARRPASGAERLLTKEDLLALVRLAWQVQGFPALRDASDRLLPADVEFAFADGELALLQIRPFVESRAARSHALLRRLDAGLRVRGDRVVDLDGTPLVPDAPAIAPGSRPGPPEPVGAEDPERPPAADGAEDPERPPAPDGAEDAEPAPAPGRAEDAGSEAAP
jgi:hypothetical protein